MQIAANPYLDRCDGLQVPQKSQSDNKIMYHGQQRYIYLLEALSIPVSTRVCELRATTACYHSSGTRTEKQVTTEKQTLTSEEKDVPNTLSGRTKHDGKQTYIRIRISRPDFKTRYRKS
ncbi:hypothetical protein ABW21_db0209786 [Orbilia brochopaga]|nr:hypothetical protein ABW21_db0209786 [Drechslerella brochopaga]